MIPFCRFPDLPVPFNGTRPTSSFHQNATATHSVVLPREGDSSQSAGGGEHRSASRRRDRISSAVAYRGGGYRLQIVDVPIGRRMARFSSSTGSFITTTRSSSRLLESVSMKVIGKWCSTTSATTPPCLKRRRTHSITAARGAGGPLFPRRHQDDQSHTWERDRTRIISRRGRSHSRGDPKITRTISAISMCRRTLRTCPILRSG